MGSNFSYYLIAASVLEVTTFRFKAQNSGVSSFSVSPSTTALQYIPPNNKHLQHCLLWIVTRVWVKVELKASLHYRLFLLLILSFDIYNPAKGLPQKAGTRLDAHNSRNISSAIKSDWCALRAKKMHKNVFCLSERVVFSVLFRLLVKKPFSFRTFVCYCNYEPSLTFFSWSFWKGL